MPDDDIFHANAVTGNPGLSSADARRGFDMICDRLGYKLWQFSPTLSHAGGGKSADCFAMSFPSTRRP